MFELTFEARGVCLHFWALLMLLLLPGASSYLLYLMNFYLCFGAFHRYHHNLKVYLAPCPVSELALPSPGIALALVSPHWAECIVTASWSVLLLTLQASWKQDKVFLSFTCSGPFKYLAPKMPSMLLNLWTKHLVHTMLICIHLESCTFRTERDIRKYLSSLAHFENEKALTHKNLSDLLKVVKSQGGALRPGHLIHTIFCFIVHRKLWQKTE